MKKKFKQRGQKIVRKITANTEKHVKKNFLLRLPSAKNVRLLILEWGLLVATLIFLAITQVFWHSSSYSTSVYTDGGTFTEATIGKVNSLNPLYASTGSEKTISRLLFATLTATDRSGHTGLGLAESVISDETGKIWTVALRKNLKWSDGEPITNTDVLFTVKLIQNSTANTIFSSNLAGVSVAENEEGKLVFNLPTAYADFATALEIPIIPEHILRDVEPAKILEHKFSSTSPITSGPFSYNATQVVNTDSGEKIVFLAANENYYGGRPQIDTFAIHNFTTVDEIKGAINEGKITGTADFSAEEIKNLKNSTFVEQKSPIHSGVFAFLNTKSEFLKEKSLRQAIQLGVDTEELIRSTGEKIALDYPVLSSQVELENFSEIPSYNLEAAKNILAEMGFQQEYPLQVATVSTGELPKLADMFISQLEKIGIKAEKTIYEPNQEFLMNVVRQRSYDILLYEIEMGAEPDLFAYYHSSQASPVGFNLSNYRSTLADDAILAIRSTMDESLKKVKLESFLRYWVSDVPAIGIYQGELSYYRNKNTKVFNEENSLVTAEDRFVDVEDWGVIRTSKNRTP